MSYYSVRKIYPWLYSLRDPQNAFCYLAVGSERALLFDTAFGIGSLPEAIRETTDKPVTAVLGHGHVDHVGGAYQFDEVWLHESDFELCGRHASEKSRRRSFDKISRDEKSLPEGFDLEAYFKAGTGNLRKLEHGRVFGLGGLHMEVVDMAGHTAGSVGLLAREHRVLLDSDSAGDHVWMFLRESLPVKRYIEMLERVAGLEFDVFFTGHSDAPKPRSDFGKYINAARNASLEKARPYPVLPEFGGYIYEEDGAQIVFHPDKL